MFDNGVATFSLNGLKAGDYNVSIRVADAVGFAISTNFSVPVRIATAGGTSTTSPPTTTTSTTTPKAATTIGWRLAPLGCGLRPVCSGYAGLVLDASGNPIAESLTYKAHIIETGTISYRLTTRN